MNRLVKGNVVVRERDVAGLRQRRINKFFQQLSAYSFLLPALLLFALFAWYPMINSFVMSFQNVKLAGESTWIGFDNYDRMFHDPNFITSLE